MTVYLVIREDQNQHGFVDSEVIGAFARKATAQDHLEAEATEAREAGEKVDGYASCPAGEWEVSLRLEEHELHD